MKANQTTLMEQYEAVSVFCAEHLTHLWPTNKVKKWLSHFNVKVSAIVVITQHSQIATRGSEDFLHSIKEPLGRLAADIAQLMKLLTGRKSGWWRKLPNMPILLSYEEDRFIEECLFIYNTANKLLATLEKKGLSMKMVQTLKTAIDVYNAIIPAPKTAKAVGQHYQNTIDILVQETGELLSRELDPAVLEAAARKPDIITAYKKLRGL